MAPFTVPARHEAFRFSRDWLRGEFGRVNDPRDPDFGVALKLTLPAEHLFTHRVWLRWSASCASSRPRSRCARCWSGGCRGSARRRPDRSPGRDAPVRPGLAAPRRTAARSSPSAPQDDELLLVRAGQEHPRSCGGAGLAAAGSPSVGLGPGTPCRRGAGRPQRTAGGPPRLGGDRVAPGRPGRRPRLRRRGRAAGDRRRAGRAARRERRRRPAAAAAAAARGPLRRHRAAEPAGFRAPRRRPAGAPALPRAGGAGLRGRGDGRPVRRSCSRRR